MIGAVSQKEIVALSLHEISAVFKTKRMWKLWADLVPPNNMPFLAACNPEVLYSEC